MGVRIIIVIVCCEATANKSFYNNGPSFLVKGIIRIIVAGMTNKL